MDLSEVMKKAAEIASREHESLVARFITTYPDVPLDQIEVCSGFVEESGHSIYRVWVRRRKNAS